MSFFDESCQGRQEAHHGSKRCRSKSSLWVRIPLSNSSGFATGTFAFRAAFNRGKAASLRQERRSTWPAPPSGSPGMNKPPALSTSSWMADGGGATEEEQRTRHPANKGREAAAAMEAEREERPNSRIFCVTRKSAGSVE